ncbi:MAG: glycosyltransferase 87 family protein [Sumerlaeia bacterium]
MKQQTQDRMEKALVFVMAGLSLYSFIRHFIVIPVTTLGVDYKKHWMAADAILRGVTPYQGEELYLGFNYPLLTGFIFLYLRAFPYEVSELPWDIGNALFVMAGYLLLAFGLWPKNAKRSAETGLDGWVLNFLIRYWPLFTFVIISHFQPLHRVMIAANIDPFNFFLACGLAVCFVQRKEKLAGIFLIFLSLVKIAPVLLWVPVAGCRRWKVLVTMFSGLTLYLVFLLVSGFWRWEIFLYQETLPRIPFYWQDISLSIHKFAALHLLPHALEDEHLYRHLVLGINIAIALPYMALIAWWSLRKKAGNHALMLAFGMPMVLIFTPLLEINHFVWAAPAMFLQLREWIFGRLSMRLFAALGLAWGGVMAMETLAQLPLYFSLPFHNITFQVIWLVLLALISGVAAFRGDAPETSTPSADQAAVA